MRLGNAGLQHEQDALQGGIRSSHSWPAGAANPRARGRGGTNGSTSARNSSLTSRRAASSMISVSTRPVMIDTSTDLTMTPRRNF